MKKPPNPHYRHRFPADLISHAVWLYRVFSLSFRDVELLLAERGIIVSYESIRRWCLKFGSAFADNLRRSRPRPGDKWYLDEVFIRIQGELRYLWRAVDQDGFVLDILVQSRRDGAAAKRFFKRLLPFPNSFHYASPEADALLEAAVEPDAAKRREELDGVGRTVNVAQPSRGARWR